MICCASTLYSLSPKTIRLFYMFYIFNLFLMWTKKCGKGTKNNNNMGLVCQPCLQIIADWHTDVIKARMKWLELVCTSSRLACAKTRVRRNMFNVGGGGGGGSRHTESCSTTHLHPVFDLLVVGLLLQESVQLCGQLLLS